MEAGGAEEGCEAGGGGEGARPGAGGAGTRGAWAEDDQPLGAGLLCGLGSRGGVCGSAPPLRVRLCLLFAGSTGAASTFFLGCECGAGSGGEGAAMSRGHERALVSEDGCGGLQEPLPGLMSLSGRPTARRTPGSRSWSLCGA